MNDRQKLILIILSGFLTFLLSFFIPIGGGGISLILALTIPFFIGLGIIFGIIYYAFIKKIKNRILKNGIFFGMFFLIIILTFVLYPYT
jgi:hypothetical protein